MNDGGTQPGCGNCNPDHCRCEQVRYNEAKAQMRLAGVAVGMQAATIQAETQQITPRQRILEEAMRITHHDRNANYGNPEDNFQHIANLWNAYLAVSRPGLARITSGDVAVMNMLIKVARLGNNIEHHDSAVDVAGYAACLGDIQASLRRLKINPVETDKFMTAYTRAKEAVSILPQSQNSTLGKSNT